MGSLKNKYITGLVILNALLVLGLLFCRTFIFLDVRPFVWSGIAIAFLFLYELMLILVTRKKSDTISPRKSINLFLGLKVGKILLSLLFITVYAIAIKIELRSFILVFMALYFIYLLFDTIYLTKNEKIKKK
ncbi:MAG: hypothetical protein LBT25_08610 [Candidatus Symbiothrix sp.]|jgi:hypothetical protein|nr:hypothetical protein [Candidatus Symbiothrix sp.]